MNGNARVEQFILPQRWWAIAVQGLVALIFGILVLAFPKITLEVFIIFFGLFCLLGGIFALITGISPADDRNRTLLILRGVFGIAVGIITFAWPGITAVVLLCLVAIWALVIGIVEVVTITQMPKEFKNSKALLGLSGFLSIVLGILLLTLPIAGILAIIWLIGIYAIIVGIALIVFGFTQRSKQKQA